MKELILRRSLFLQSDKKPSSLWDEKYCVEHEHVMSSTPWNQLDDLFPNNNMFAMSRLIPPIMSQEMKNEYSIYDTKVNPFFKNGHSNPVIIRYFGAVTTNIMVLSSSLLLLDFMWFHSYYILMVSYEFNSLIFVHSLLATIMILR